jgi:phosphoenolpyruvate carboxylase
MDNQAIIASTRLWISSIVIGLNLCPFAQRVFAADRIRYVVIDAQDETALLDDLANEGYKAYLDLKQHPKFVPYLEKVTPLSFFGDTNIGSRPVKRNAADGLKFEDLRAIPFVGSWAMRK